MQRRTKLVMAVLTAFLVAPTLADANGRTQQRRVRGKRVTKYKLNPQAFQRQFGWAPESIKRALSVEVRHPALQGGKDMVGTHTFGQSEIKVIPAHDATGSVRFANGKKLVRGDHELSKALKPGEFGFLVHQRQANGGYAKGVVDMTRGAMDPNTAKELAKIWDTHISIATGVKRVDANGKRRKGVVTFNMPQGYPGGDEGAGRFGLYDSGQWAYGNLTLLKPKMPTYLSKSQKRAFNKNMFTMLAGFNAVSNFPGDYNGSDPLSVKTPAEVRHAVKMMIQGVAGSAAEQAAARTFFAKKENLIYCAELAFTALSAAMHAPLNTRTVVSELGVSAETWGNFKREIGKHNSGQRSAFTSKNSAENEQIKHAKIGVSPKNLKAAHEYAPAEQRAAEGQKMAFGPMKASDIIANALAVQFPRSKWGEARGSVVQRHAWEAMKPGVLEQISGNGAGQTAEQQAAQGAAIQQLFGQIDAVVGREHANYGAFRDAIRPLVYGAQQLPGLNFVPPHLLHLSAMSPNATWVKAGMVGLEYAGTVVNAKLLDKVTKYQPAAAE